MASIMEQIVDEMVEYLNGCKQQMFSGGTKIIVDREQMDDLINRLREKTPEEIKRYQKIINQKDAILNDAKQKAEQMIARAESQTKNLVSEHQIMQQAYAEANEVVKIATQQAEDILTKATDEANEIRMMAMNYTDGQLKSIEDILTNSIETAKARNESLVNSLQGFLDVVSGNRAQLYPEVRSDMPPVTPSPVEKRRRQKGVETVDLGNITISKGETEEN